MQCVLLKLVKQKRKWGDFMNEKDWDNFDFIMLVALISLLISVFANLCLH